MTPATDDRDDDRLDDSQLDRLDEGHLDDGHLDGGHLDEGQLGEGQRDDISDENTREDGQLGVSDESQRNESQPGQGHLEGGQLDDDTHSVADSELSEEVIESQKEAKAVISRLYSNRDRRKAIADQIEAMRERSQAHKFIRPSKIQEVQRAWKRNGEGLETIKRDFLKLRVENVGMEESFHELTMEAHSVKRKAGPTLRALLKNHVKRSRKRPGTEDENDTDYSVLNDTPPQPPTPPTPPRAPVKHTPVGQTASRGGTASPRRLGATSNRTTESDVHTARVHVVLAAMQGDREEDQVIVQESDDEVRSDDQGHEQGRGGEAEATQPRRPEPFDADLLLGGPAPEAPLLQRVPEGHPEPKSNVDKALEELRTKVERIEGDIQGRLKEAGDKFTQHMEEMMVGVTSMVTNETARIYQVEVACTALSGSISSLNSGQERINQKLNSSEKELGLQAGKLDQLEGTVRKLDARVQEGEERDVERAQAIKAEFSNLSKYCAAELEKKSKASMERCIRHSDEQQSSTRNDLRSLRDLMSSLEDKVGVLEISMEDWSGQRPGETHGQSRKATKPSKNKPERYWMPPDDLAPEERDHVLEGQKKPKPQGGPTATGQGLSQGGSTATRQELSQKDRYFTRHWARQSRPDPPVITIDDDEEDILGQHVPKPEAMEDIEALRERVQSESRSLRPVDLNEYPPTEWYQRYLPPPLELWTPIRGRQPGLQQQSVQTPHPEVQRKEGRLPTVALRFRISST